MKGQLVQGFSLFKDLGSSSLLPVGPRIRLLPLLECENPIPSLWGPYPDLIPALTPHLRHRVVSLLLTLTPGAFELVYAFKIISAIFYLIFLCVKML